MSHAARITKEVVSKVYEQIAAEYDDRIPGTTALDERFAETERAFLFDRITHSDDVLDIGCGTGRFTIPLAAKAASVVGMDMSEAMLDRARGKAAAEGVQASFRQGDMAAMPFEDATFDAVVSMLALMHVPVEERRTVFGEIARVLRPGGRLLIGVKNSVFEQMSEVDRFATVDVTDVRQGELVFTGTRGGQELRAPWRGFSPDELRLLAAVNGLIPTGLRGNIPIAAWLDTSLLQDPGVRSAISALERVVGSAAPFNHLGYHLLFEAVKPAR